MAVLDVVDFPGYEVSDLGLVWTRKRNSHRQLAQYIDDDGYARVELWRDGKRKMQFVHRLVLTAFVGPCPPGMETRHKDGNPRNNAIENIRWDTPKANQADRLLHGTDSRGESHGAAKLTEAEVFAISEAFQNGEPPEIIALRFGVSEGTITGIESRNTWRHLPLPPKRVKCRTFEHNGVVKTLTELAAEAGISRGVLYARLQSGWDFATAIAEPQCEEQSLTFRGRTQTMAEWARELNLSYLAIYCRINKGWEVERALTTPIRPKAKAKLREPARAS